MLRPASKKELQLLEAEQDFKRETQRLDQEFQLGRDKTQQLHERGMVKLKDTSKKKATDDAMAFSLASAAKGNPAFGTALISAVEGQGAGGLLLGKQMRALGFEDASAVSDLLQPFVLAAGDNAFPIVTSNREATKALEERYKTQVGILPSEEWNSTNQAAQDQRYNTWGKRLAGIEQQTQGLGAQLESAGSLPLEQRGAALSALESSREGLGTSLEALEGGEFMGTDAAANRVNAVLNSLSTSRAAESAVASSTRSLLQQRTDFRETTLEAFLADLRTAGNDPKLRGDMLDASVLSVGTQLKAIDKVIQLLRDTPQSILELAEVSSADGVPAALSRFITQVKELAPGEELSGESILRAYAGLMTDDGATAGAALLPEIGGQFQLLSAMDHVALQSSITRVKDNIRATATARTALAPVAKGFLSELGVEIVPEDFRKRFGEESPTGVMEWDPSSSPKKMWTDPAFTSAIADKLADIGQGLSAANQDELTTDALALYSDNLPDSEAKDEQVGEMKLAVGKVRSARREASNPIKVDTAEDLVSESLQYAHELADSGVGSFATSGKVTTTSENRSAANGSVDRGQGTFTAAGGAAATGQAEQVLSSTPTVGAISQLFSLWTDRSAPSGSAYAFPNTWDAHAEKGLFGELGKLRFGVDKIQDLVFDKLTQGRIPTGVTLGEDGSPAMFRTGAGREVWQTWADTPESREFATSKKLTPGEGDDPKAIAQLNTLRVLDLKDLYSNITPEKFAYLEGLQASLRNLTPEEASQFARGDLPMVAERLNLDPKSLDAFALDSARGREAWRKGQLPDGVLDKEIARLERAAVTLAGKEDRVDTGVWFDFDPDDDGFDPHVLTQERYHTFSTNVATSLSKLRAMKVAREALATNGSQADDLAVMLGSGAFPTSVAELGTTLVENAPLVHQLDTDMLEAGTKRTYWDAFAATLQGADSTHAIKTAMAAFSSNYDRIMVSAHPGSDGVPESEQLAYEDEQARSLNDFTRAYNGFLEKLTLNQDWQASDANVDVRGYLMAGKFDDMPNGTDEAIRWRALALTTAAFRGFAPR